MGGSRSRLAAFLGIGLAGLCLAAAGPVPASGEEAHAIGSIRSLAGHVEVEVRSSTPFPVRAEPPVLRIGSREFQLSRSPADGRLDTLIFILTPAKFAQIAYGEPVSVHYGRDGTGHQWLFGPLNKALATSP